jgi:hypothetical protein
MILCFAAGVYASRRIIVSPKPSTIQAYVEDKGNASAAVRSGVLRSMNDFQDGYTRRDPAQLEAFMRTVFPSEGNMRVIGSEVNEWKNGPAAVSQLVKTDWQYWGNLKLAIDDTVIDSEGEVAWLATTGTVAWPSYTRSLRFAAVLTRHDDRWLFRQIVFQWDERPVTLSDLLAKGNVSRIHLQ